MASDQDTSAVRWLALAALVLSFVAIALAGLRSGDVDPPPGGTVEASVPRSDLAPLRTHLQELESRVGLLERAPLRPREASESFRPGGSGEPETIRTSIESTANGTLLAELAKRVANLEAARRRAQDEARELVAPDSIPARLAVLLASRGVVTEVGDVEAIQANLTVLAELAADPSAPVWDRIEAYRGMLVFGVDSPELCVQAMPAVATILTTSSDAKARRSAAAMLQNHKNPAIAATLMAAYQSEQDDAAREQIVKAMLPLIDDPGLRQTLVRAQRNEASDEIRKLIDKALAGWDNR